MSFFPFPGTGREYGEKRLTGVVLGVCRPSVAYQSFTMDILYF